MLGTLLAGRYMLAEALGSGGAGSVYRATDLRTGGSVAVKLLHPLLAQNPTWRERLRREAQIAAQLTSPRIVRVIDLAEEEGGPFLVLEYVAGETLEERLRQHGPLAPGTALAIAIEVAHALAAAHAAGIVHRDLKPQNISLVDGQVKVLDFGIAHMDDLAGLTQAGGFVGTPEYAAPEQAAGHGDIRSDIYALGVVLYRMVTGRTPFSGPTALAVLRHHEETPPPLPNSLPEPLREVLARCLAKLPTERYQSPAALVEALTAALETLSGRSTGADSSRTDGGGGFLPLSLSAALHRASSPSSPTPTDAMALPVPLTSFVGRERELAELRNVLVTTRLLTLTGAGGAGKTRLALQLATDPARGVATPDGQHQPPARLVALATLSEAALVQRAVAASVGVRETAGRPLQEALVEALRPQRLLLVLDNCEHVVVACATLATQLLSACPQLQILATSREALGVAGEITWSVPPLSAPEIGEIGHPDAPVSLDRLATSESVRLFVERAGASRPGFTLNDGNAQAIAEVCARLDGLPLAIELAAARVRVLSVAQIAARLGDRFRLLTGGGRTALPHQQTLRAAMDWSYDLLGTSERVLFRRLGVFVGGWTLVAAETITRDPSAQTPDSALVGPTPPSPAWDREPDFEVLDGLAALVDKSLVQRSAGEHGEPRFSMLQTVREYALVRLSESGEEAPLRDQHLTYYLNVAEAAERPVRGAGNGDGAGRDAASGLPAARAAAVAGGSEQIGWLNRLERERDNLRAALEWSAAPHSQSAGGAGGATDRGHRRWSGLRLAVALGWFWYLRGYRSEGRSRLEALLALLPPTAALAPDKAVTRARALGIAGHLSFWSGDPSAALRLAEAAVVEARATGDPLAIAWALVYREVVDPDQNGRRRRLAGERWQESLEQFRAAAEPWGEALALARLGALAQNDGEIARAAQLLAESLALFRRLGDRWGITLALARTADLDERRGDDDAAEARFREQQVLAQELGHRGAMAGGLSRLAALAERRGDIAQAVTDYEHAVALFRVIGEVRSAATPLAALARLAASVDGDFQRAETLLRESVQINWEYDDRAALLRVLLIWAEVAVLQGHLQRGARLLGAVEGALDAERPLSGVAEDTSSDTSSDLAAERAAIVRRLHERAPQEAWEGGRLAGATLTLEGTVADLAGVPRSTGE
ncbi:MAG: serine/threonine-protein kinase [Chloroflexota bacterium]|nr:serine/threonine-protein kinase [Chloroflexota bacterium]